MRAFPLLALVVATPLLLLAARQNPPPEPPKPREQPVVPITPSEGGRKEMARITRDLQGLWRLKELDWPRIRGQSSESRGYCLVGGNHLALEIHIGLRGPDQKFKDVMLDSGTWRIDLEEGGRMALTALIGSFIDKDNRVAFREAGTRHRYAVMVSGDRLVLTHDDGQKITFERALDEGPVLRDAFGRPLPEKKDEGSNADGEKKDGGGKVGNPKKDEPKGDGAKKDGDDKGGEKKLEKRSLDSLGGG